MFKENDRFKQRDYSSVDFSFFFSRFNENGLNVSNEDD